MRDIRTMLAVSDASIDQAVLREWIDRLRLRPQWDEVTRADPP